MLVFYEFDNDGVVIKYIGDMYVIDYELVEDFSIESLLFNVWMFFYNEVFFVDGVLLFDDLFVYYFYVDGMVGRIYFYMEELYFVGDCEFYNF